MINGIENFDEKLQKAIIQFISEKYDLSEDINISEGEEYYIVTINDDNYIVLTNEEADELIDDYNDTEFDIFFGGLDEQQLKYIDRFKWEDNEGACTFEDWISANTDFRLVDSYYVGGYNFYEVR